MLLAWVACWRCAMCSAMVRLPLARLHWRCMSRQLLRSYGEPPRERGRSRLLLLACHGVRILGIDRRGIVARVIPIAW